MGKYEGDALVIETVGLKPGWIDPTHPHSDALRLVERYRRVDHQTIELKFTVDDPKVRPLKSAADVDEALAQPGTTLIVVNSICGCAAGSARPGITSFSFSVATGAR